MLTSWIQRYSSQIILPEIGALGQKKICDAKVLIIGVGGLNGSVLLSLSSSYRHWVFGFIR